MSKVSEEHDIPDSGDNHYAVVDLGSNSFHLLITFLNRNNSFQTVNKVKRKVRLASGLDEQNRLSSDAIERGLNCLTLFATHLQNIPLNNISIVATATLRIAQNRDEFLQAANQILPKKIQLLSGIQEAETIFLGATLGQKNRTKKCVHKQLVLDIGGASTELIVGENSTAKKATSLNLGCVSFRKKYFIDDVLTADNFTQAICAATEIIQPIAAEYIKLGWQTVVGGSGTMQALAEILLYRNQPVVISANFLHEIQKALIECQHIDSINKNEFFSGLRADRIPVLASGLAILIALFHCLAIDNLQLSKGALREGLLFSLLD